jgi:hypothetical protein
VGPGGAQQDVGADEVHPQEPVRFTRRISAKRAASANQSGASGPLIPALA